MYSKEKCAQNYFYVHKKLFGKIHSKILMQVTLRGGMERKQVGGVGFDFLLKQFSNI